MKKVLATGMSLATLGLGLGLPLSSAAQTAGAFMKNPAFSGAPPQQCVSTVEMQHCAAHELRVADAEMSQRYAEVRASLGAAAQKKLLTEQRGWLKSRDRDCLAQGRDGGSMASIAVARCWVEVTKERAASLEARLAPKATAEGPWPAAAFLGRWRGGEGTVMKISRKGEGFSIENQWGLDAGMRGTFAGALTAAGLRFERGGVVETARPGPGDSVNRSALRGKRDCLVVSQDEGYCRY